MSFSFKHFWDFASFQEKRWFRFLSITLFSICCIYILLHLVINSGPAGFELSRLNTAEVQQINKIYFDSSLRQSSANTNPGKQRGTISADSPRKTDIPAAENPNNSSKSIVDPKDSSCLYCTKADRVIQYLHNEFETIQQEQLDSIKNYISCASDADATSFLANSKLKVRSYFWLNGAATYLEVLFWTLFGVFCNLLFNLGVISKNSTTNPMKPETVFDPTEIPSQVAKMLYAPICTIVIILGYNFFTSQSLADISSGKGVLVFSFIAGYNSSRLISLLDRLKDLLLPINGTSTAPQVARAPLKNLLLEFSFDARPADKQNIPYTGDLTQTIISLKDDKDQPVKTARLSAQPFVLIADYLAPGKFVLNAVLKVKDSAGAAIPLSAEQEIEMKTDDQYIKIELK